MGKYRKVTKGRYKGLFVKKNKKGYITSVFNPKGKLKHVAISQRGNYSGFTAHYVTKPYRKVARSKNAEGMAGRLAKKGHRIVTFWD